MDRTIMLQMGRSLVVAGLVVAAVGLLFMTGAKWPFFRLGRLPGDIEYRGRNIHFYFPVVTCLVLSVAVTLLLKAISFFTKK